MITIGLAGHIDHGKSSLVRAITHMNPDRLPEERRRGMTIDLGFSWLTIAGRTVGFVDVPGHKDFMRNVCAGLSATDAALLVVAGDDGWMPQTAEHFQILQFFHVRHGIVAITKIGSIADPDWLDLVEDDIQSRLRDTCLAGASIIRVDSLAGTNIAQLQEGIAAVIAKIEHKQDIGKPRLPIDRVFSRKGVGTVVTGTLIDGSLAKDQDIYVPRFQEYRRIRSLETYKQPVDQAQPGSRVAINLVGVDKSDLRRGDVLFGHQQHAVGTHSFDASISLVSAAADHSVRSMEVMVYLGTLEIHGTMRLLASGSAASDGTFARLSFKQQVHARVGDRFIIRRPSPPETMGGGTVLDVSPRLGRWHASERLAYLHERSSLSVRALVLSELAKIKYARIDRLLTPTTCSPAEIARCVAMLANEERIVTVGQWVISSGHWKAQVERSLGLLAADHRAHALETGMRRATLQTSIDIPEDVLGHFLGTLQNAGLIVVHGDSVALPSHKPSFSRKQDRIVARIMQLFGENPANPPASYELANLLPGCESVVQYLCRQHVLHALPDGILLEHSQYVRIKSEIIEFLQRNGMISIQQVRDMFGLSRKYILPLMAQLDKEGVTVKEGDLRALATQKNVAAKRDATQ